MVTHFPLADPATATGETADLLAQTKQRRGKLINIDRALASSPTMMRSYLALSASANEGPLTPQARELIAIASAQRNGCEYCLSAHTQSALHSAHLSQTEIDAARHNNSTDPHLDAVLKIAFQIATQKGIVADDELAAAQAAGVTDAELGQILALVILNTMTNYFNNLAHTEVDFPLVVP